MSKNKSRTSLETKRKCVEIIEAIRGNYLRRKSRAKGGA